MKCLFGQSLISLALAFLLGSLMGYWLFRIMWRRVRTSSSSSSASNLAGGGPDFQGQLDALHSEHEACGSIRGKLEKELSALRFEHGGVKTALVEREDQVKSLRLDIDKAKDASSPGDASKMSALREEVDTHKTRMQGLIGEVDAHKQQVAKLNAELTTIRSQYGSLQTTAAAEREKAVAEARSQISAELNANPTKEITARVRTEAAAEHDTTLKARIASLTNDHDVLLVSVRQEHETNLGNARAEYEQTLVALRNDHEGSLGNLRADHEQSLAAHRSDHETTIARFAGDHRASAANLQAQLDAAREAGIEAEGELGRMRVSLGEVETERDRVRNDLGGADAELDRLRAEQAAVVAERDRTRNDLAGADAELGRLRGEFALRDSGLNQLERDLQSARSSHGELTSHMQGLTGQVESREGELASLRASLEASHESGIEAEAELAQLRRQLVGAKQAGAEAERLAAELDAAETALADANNERNERNGRGARIQALEAELGALRNSQVGSQDLVNSLRTEGDRLRHELTSAQTEAHGARAHLAEESAAHESTRKRVGMFEQQIQGFTTTLSEREGRIASHRSSLAEREAELASLRAELTGTQSDGDDLQRIEGIGPKIDAALRAAGIKTFVELADSSEESLQNAIEASGMSFAPSLVTWAGQSRYLANGDEPGFVAYTERLTAGCSEEG